MFKFSHPLNPDYVLFMIYQISILQLEIGSSTNSVVLYSISDLSSIGFFKRYFARDLLNFGVQTAATKAPNKTVFKLEIQNFDQGVVFAYRKEGLVCCTVVDKTYPTAAVSKVLLSCLSEFVKELPFYKQRELSATGKLPEKVPKLSFAFLEKNFSNFQNPRNVDKLAVLDEQVKEILADTKNIISKTLERGEKLNQMMEKSNQISEMSKRFYKTAHDKNAGCCG